MTNMIMMPLHLEPSLWWRSNYFSIMLYICKWCTNYFR